MLIGRHHVESSRRQLGRSLLSERHCCALEFFGGEYIIEIYWSPSAVFKPVTCAVLTRSNNWQQSRLLCFMTALAVCWSWGCFLFWVRLHACAHLRSVGVVGASIHPSRRSIYNSFCQIDSGFCFSIYDKDYNTCILVKYLVYPPLINWLNDCVYFGNAKECKWHKTINMKIYIRKKKVRSNTYKLPPILLE